ncbi:T9SS type A sorting domain-containing protein [Flavilitoribacter nigricans]|uniref:Ig-like domain-containing protein n=1 Tax=Flavilitoribacter nigricans (strain ATCC 23147 / DSM 23189 / NBRC 102662 / NCIMB 1420 / SS-2) TaxID=1122177 RepID=A0A2D0N9N8_FLAN2|nr:T9SS type A sorting domain-containing protein [Flavilitoribacter nigricans]PHN05232.1 hypothetical protein CRP01_17080 [Flavilitoribacter nigricans DSM 23189 = NBRC 102662]
MPKTPTLLSILLALTLAATNLLAYSPHAGSPPPDLNVPVFVCDRATDSLSLVQFYQALDGPNWKTTWDLNQPMETWYGITLNAAGCVERISLGNNGLTGTLIDLNLPELDELYLINNAIVGSIPDFSQLPALRSLYLSFNDLSGPVPDFSALPILRSLYLSGNELSGTIPDFTSLPALFYLVLERNQLEGEIPDFSNLFNLRTLVLADNQLSGCLPDFTNCGSLDFIRVEKNDLSCTVPAYAHILGLDMLLLYDNQFTFEDILPNLESIQALINSNRFDNQSPDTLRYEPQQQIYADTTIYALDGMPVTIDLQIDDTVSTSQYDWFKDGVYFQTVMGDNELHFANFTAADVGIYHCQITNPNAPDLTLESKQIFLEMAGATPCRQADSLMLVDLYQALNGPGWTNSWDLNQPLENWYGVELNVFGCVLTLDLDYNQVAGVLPTLNFAQLRLLDLSLNNLNGTDLSGFVGTSSLPNLRELNLSWCNLFGTLPDFAGMPELDVLNLDKNNFSGEIPDFIACPKLSAIALAENALTGSIPGFSHLTELRFLNLYQNQLDGQIPEFANATKLEYLVLADNKLSGCLPAFANSLELNTIIVAINELDCLIPYYGHLPKLRELNFRTNRLTFEDILPTLADNTAHITGIGGGPVVYIPQKMVPLPPVVSNYEGESVTIDLLVDDALSANVYQWYRGENLLQEIQGNNEWTLDNLELADAGYYYCVITNPDLPDLTLTSEEIQVSVSPRPECMDNVLTVNEDPIPEGTSWIAADTLKSSGTISIGADGVTFIAGKTIRLLPGFQAPAGSVLRAYILECEPPAPVLNAPETGTLSVAETPSGIVPGKATLTAYPNPGRQHIQLQYFLPQATDLQLLITDPNGTVIRNLHNDIARGEGSHTTALDVTALPAGIYYVHLVTGHEKITTRIVVFH